MNMISCSLIYESDSENYLRKIPSPTIYLRSPLLSFFLFFLFLGEIRIHAYTLTPCLPLSVLDNPSPLYYNYTKLYIFPNEFLTITH